jgi:CheY-like chemotaxis protein
LDKAESKSYSWVLMVEDNPSDVRLVQAAVKQVGSSLDVTHVCDGDAALQHLGAEAKARRELPSLILLDLNLPGKTGFEVLDELRAHPKLREIPVVILTSSQREEDVERSYRHGASSYIAKPNDFVELCQAIETLDNYWYGLCRLPSRNGRTHRDLTGQPGL